MLVAFNKIDLPAAAEAWPAFRRARAADGLAGRDLGGDRRGASTPSARALADAAARRRRAGRAAGAGRRRRPPDRARWATASVVEPEDGAFRVRGRRIERIAAQTNFEVEESAERFQRDLARLGIDAALRRAGVEPGDTRPDRRDRARVGGPAVGGARDGGAPRRRPTAAVASPVSGSSAGRSTRSTSATSRSPRRPRESSGSTGRSFIPAAPAAAQAGRRDRAGARTGWRWSSSRSPATRPPARAGSSSTATGPSYTIDTLDGAARRGRGGRPRAWTRRDPVGRRVRRAADLARPGAPPRASSASAVAPRDGLPAPPSEASLPDLPERRAGHHDPATGPRLDVSATEIRRARRRRAIRSLPRRPSGRADTSRTMHLYRRPAPARTPRDRSRRADDRDHASAARARAPDGLPHRGGRRALRAAAARCRPPDRRARRGQEGGRHRAARPDRPDDARRLLRHLLGRVGAAARRDRRRHRRAGCATRRCGRSGGRAPRPRTGCCSTSARSSSTSSRRPSATTTRSRSTGRRRRRSCGSSSRVACGTAVEGTDGSCRAPRRAT